jgi:hypothetical protein
MVEQTQFTSETIIHWAVTNNWQRTVSDTCMTWLFACYNMFRLPPTVPQWLTYVGLCFHIVWCNRRGVGDGEILETYWKSGSKNTLETDIFSSWDKIFVDQCNESPRLSPNSMYVFLSRCWSLYVHRRWYCSHMEQRAVLQKTLQAQHTANF